MLAAVLLGAGVLVFQAWSADNELRQRAEEAAAKPTELVRPQAAQSAAGESDSPAGDGVAAADGTARYWACASGVYRQASASGKAQGQAILLADESAACLNVAHGALYYLSSDESNAEIGTGTTVHALDNPSQAAGSETASVLYEARDDVMLSSLSMKGDTLYFIASDGDSRALMGLPCDGSSDAQELKRFDAEAIWTFIEGDGLYVVHTFASSWSVDHMDLRAEGAVFEPWISGTGQLRAACMSDGALFYSLSQWRGSSHLCRRDATGGFSEYDDVDDAVRIAADGDVVAVVTQRGDLLWTDAVTGFTYDASAALEGALGNPIPSTVGLSVLDVEICCAERTGSAFSYNVNNGEVHSIEVEEEVR